MSFARRLIGVQMSRGALAARRLIFVCRSWRAFKGGFSAWPDSGLRATGAGLLPVPAVKVKTLKVGASGAGRSAKVMLEGLGAPFAGKFSPAGARVKSMCGHIWGLR